MPQKTSPSHDFLPDIPKGLPTSFAGQPSPSPVFPPIDPLTAILDSLHVHAFVTGISTLTAPWGLGMTNAGPGFFVILEGHALLEVAGTPAPIPLSAGEFVVFTREHSHQIRDALTSAVTPVHQLLTPEHFRTHRGLIHGGGGAATRLVGGAFIMDRHSPIPLLDALPIAIRFAPKDGLPWLPGLLSFMNEENQASSPGSPTIVSRLAVILLLQAIREHLASVGEKSPGYLRAMMDPDMSRALALMHTMPEKDHTVASLATHAASSRSRFSARFTELVGQPPLSYLTKVRMDRACDLLRSTTLTLKQLASAVGYESEASFSHAFKRFKDVAPGAFRHAAAGSENGHRSAAPSSALASPVLVTPGTSAAVRRKHPRRTPPSGS